MLKRIFLLFIAALFITLTLPASVYADPPGDCDGTTGNDTITCLTNPTNPDNQVEADLGNDQITVASGVTTGDVNGDGQPGNYGDLLPGVGGDDVIINNGTVVENEANGQNGQINGDYIDGPGGDDTIINNGTVFGLAGDIATSQGGNDIITNNGIASGGIAGDVMISGDGGDDTIINNASGHTGLISGDLQILLGTGDGGDDVITNHGFVEITPSEDPSAISGDIRGDQVYALSNGGNDQITNTGTVEGNILGDFIISGDPLYYPELGEGGEDIIFNSGIVYGNINGDYIGSEDYDADLDETVYTSAGEGAADQITNSGTVGGTIFAEGGDDTVTLQIGADGGADHTLLIDGGAGTDPLFFEFGYGTTLNGTPANGNVTINSETFQWVNFETVQFSDPIPGDCDGTPNNDVINCTTNPVNPDAAVEADAGNDQITIGAGVTAYSVSGDTQPGYDGDMSPGISGNDVIVNNGLLLGDVASSGEPTLNGDGVEGPGGDDTLTNNGTTNVIAGDFANTQGGNDTITNNGIASAAIIGDLMISGAGGNDTILNNAAGETSLISGDFIILYGTGNGGDDVITNHGTVTLIEPQTDGVVSGDIRGDDIYGLSNGGNDIITNTGTVENDILADSIIFDDPLTLGDGGEDNIINSGIVNRNIHGDYIVYFTYDPNLSENVYTNTGEGAADQITNSGTVGGTIYAEGGDDHVILQLGANGGIDHILPIDGGTGSDTLAFEFNSATTYTNFTGTPAAGSVIVNGETIQWTNFEILEGLPSASALTLITPTLNSTITNGYGNPTYVWTDTGADMYEFYLDNSLNDSVPQYYIGGLLDDTYCNGLTCSFDPTSLNESARLIDGSYVVYLRGTTNAILGAVAGPFAFTLNAPPPAPVTYAPPTGTDTLRPTFTWSLSGDAVNTTWFRLFLIKKSLFDAGNYTPTVDIWRSRTELCGSASSTTCTIQSGLDLLDDTAYYMYIQSYGPGGYSEGGAYINGWAGGEFAINVPNPVVPTVTVNPNQGRPTISWANDANATQYYVYVRTQGTNITKYLQWHTTASVCSGGTCSITPESLILANGTYEAFVYACGTGGCSTGGVYNNGWGGGNQSGSNATFTYNFLTPPGLVDGMIFNYTAGNAVVSWQSVPETTWYYVFIGTYGGAYTAHLQWVSSDALGCVNPATTCTATIPLALPAGNYYLSVQSAGPGGYSVGGLLGNGFQVLEPPLTVP